ncbi:zwei Ig domain protein zig-8-like isoform X1 [Mytilus edulis]
MARIGFYLKILEFLEILLLLPLIIKVTSYSYKRMTAEPTFLNTPRNVTVHMNELAQLQCRIKNLGPKQVAWRKVSMDWPLTVGIVTFDPKEDISVSYKDLKKQEEGLTQWDLIIKHAKPRHTGMYECQISAKNVYTHYVYLKVIDTPLVVNPAIAMYGTKFINLHEPIKLVCNATGGTRAPSLIDWFFNGHMIRGRDPRWKSRLRINDYVPDVPGRMLVSELTIDYSIFEDKGKYVCRSFAMNNFYTTSLDISVLNTEKEHGKRADTKKYSSTTDENPNSGYSANPSTSLLALTFVMLFILLR